MRDISEEQIWQHLVKNGVIGKRGLKIHADLIVQQERRLLQRLAFENSKLEELPTLKEVAAYIGANFNTLNARSYMEKQALRYGVRELKRQGVLNA